MNVVARFWYGFTLPMQAWRMLKVLHGRRYIFIPILINIALAYLMFRYGVSVLLIGYLETLLQQQLTADAEWVIPIIANVLEIFAFIVITLTAVRVGTIIGSPFYVAIAERIDMHFLGYDETPHQSLFVIVGLAVWYELRKVTVVATTWMIGVALEFVPVVGVFVAPLWLACTTALIALLDYTDVSLGRRYMTFGQRIRLFGRFLPEAIGFAVIVVPCTAIPVLNTITVPLCICGGVLWYIQRMHGTVATQLEQHA